MEPREKTNFFKFHDKTFTVVGSARDQSVMRELEVLDGRYEPHITNLLPEIINPNFVCLDIGANIGVTTLAFSSLSRDGHVYSFEPSKNNYGFLARNVMLNDAKNVTCLNLAIYDTNGTLDFSYVDEFPAGSFAATTGFVHPAVIHETVTCVKLDDWVKSSLLPRLDFVKLDVEGAEIKVLEGGKNTLEEFQPRLIVEINPHTLITFFNQEPEALFELLRALYPNVYLISRPDGALKKMSSFSELQVFMPTELHLQDLYCTF